MQIQVFLNARIQANVKYCRSNSSKTTKCGGYNVTMFLHFVLRLKLKYHHGFPNPISASVSVLCFYYGGKNV